MYPLVHALHVRRVYARLITSGFVATEMCAQMSQFKSRAVTSCVAFFHAIVRTWLRDCAGLTMRVFRNTGMSWPISPYEHKHQTGRDRLMYTVIASSASIIGVHLRIVWLWRRNLDADSSQMRRFITKTGSKMTTAMRTLSFGHHLILLGSALRIS
jgi:hypothetical protein